MSTVVRSKGEGERSPWLTREVNQRSFSFADCGYRNVDVRVRLQTYLRPVCGGLTPLLAMMESTREEPIGGNGLGGHWCYRLNPTPVRPVRHQIDGYRRSLGRKENKNHKCLSSMPPLARIESPDFEWRRPRRFERVCWQRRWRLYCGRESSAPYKPMNGVGRVVS